MRLGLENVSKSFGPTRALCDVTLDLAPGQIVALLGSNGAGKTTLMRCLAGVVLPDRGRILCDGEALTRARLDLRRRMHFLPDFPSMLPDATVLKHLAIMLRLYEATGKYSERVMLDLLREFDLLPLVDVPVQHLSRGQAYKAALLGLLLVDPDLWLLDEPFASGMDPQGISAFKSHVRQAAARGRTVIFTTQLLDLAEAIAGRVCVIHQGKVHANETVENLRLLHQSASGGVLEKIFQKLRETGS